MAAKNIPPAPTVPPKPAHPPRLKHRVIWDDWSLTSKLVTITMTLLLLSLLGTSVWTLHNFKTTLMDRNDVRLNEASEALAAEAANEIFNTGSGTDGSGTDDSGSDGSQSGTPTEQSLRGLLPSEYYVQFFNQDGTKVFNAFSDGSGDLPMLGRITSGVVQQYAGRPFTVSGNDSEWRVRALYVQKTPYLVAIAVPLDTEVQTILQRAQTAQIGIGLIALALAGAIGWLAIANAFKPLRDIERAAAAIAAGDLSQRVASAPADTELGRLSSSLNTMLGQIETAFSVRTASENRMRRFVSDASHELRTPLVTIRGYAELYRQGAITEPEDTKLAMSRIENEAKRMGGLVEDLVMLARLDEQRPSSLAPVNLLQLGEDAAADAGVQAPDREIRLVGLADVVPEPVRAVHGDEAKLRQVVTNLVSNAIRHTPPGTAIELAVGMRGEEACIEVRDHGEGIPPDQAAKVFERFYRADVSRNRDTGGSGLGLSIAAAIVASHHGSIDILATAGGGATFRVSLPSDSGSETFRKLPDQTQDDRIDP